MKNVILVYLLTNAINLFAQYENNSNTLINSTTIYKGFDNSINVSSNKFRNIYLTCVSCDSIELVKKNKTVWIINSSKLGTVTLIAKNKKGKELATKSFHVVELPKPFVLLDSMNANSIISEVPKLIKLKLDKSIPVTIGFFIKNWSINVNGTTINGSGSIFSEEVQKLIKNSGKGTLIINIEYKSSIGLDSIKEIFQFEIL